MFSKWIKIREYAFVVSVCIYSNKILTCRRKCYVAVDNPLPLRDKFDLGSPTDFVPCFVAFETNVRAYATLSASVVRITGAQYACRLGVSVSPSLT